MQKNTLLQSKRAVIFGAGGAVGGAVAKEFALQGAEVFLSGLSTADVELVAQAITEQGGTAHVAAVDALDEKAVIAYYDDIVKIAGRIDVIFNAMGPQSKDYDNCASTMQLPLEKFMLPLTTVVPSQFITARAGASHMMKQGSGVIIMLTATAARDQSRNVTSISATFGATESLVRSLARDFGPSGIRVVGIRSSGMIETRTLQQAFDNIEKEAGVTKEQIIAGFMQNTLTNYAPTLTDTAKIASFLASDGAKSITGAIINSSNGMVVD
jgi:3-oxoacyl-[acyl-carrier protein] reductase